MEILKKFNEKTVMAMENDELFVYKKIHPSEEALYRRLCVLKHPNVARIYEITRNEEDIFVKREYVNGRSLQTYLEETGNLTEKETLSVAIQICNGLQSIHSLGIVHRDITPNNIIITEEKTVKIIDFGISRIIKSNAEHDTEILGTQGYAAPEQFGFAQTDCRADIYAVGVLLNQMLTGCFPVEKMHTGNVQFVIRRCLQMDAKNRYTSAKELCKALTDISYGCRAWTDGTTENTQIGKAKIRKVLLSIYYSIASVLLIFSTMVGETRREQVCITSFFFSTLFCIVFVVADVFRWSKRISFLKTFSKDRIRLIRFIISVLIVILSLLFVIISEK